MRQVRVLAVATVVATVGVPTVASRAADAPTIVGAASVAEAPDYATEVWADPWDYRNREDLLTDRGPVGDRTTARLTGGEAVLDQTGVGYVSPVWVTYPGSLPTSRAGTTHPIDAARYRHASVRLHASERTFAAWQWFGCHDFRDECLGGTPFVVEPGWHTYTVELRNTFPGLPKPWSGQPIGLRLALNPERSGASVRYRIDWMRLHGDAPATTVRWTADGGTSRLVWDRDADPANNTPDAPGWGVLASRSGAGTSEASFPTAAYPPGAYRFYVDGPSGRSPYSSPLVVDAAPAIEVLDPDLAGGRSYAEDVLGDAWDMGSPRDVARVGNARDVTFAGGVLQATNTTNDPYVQLRLGPGGIDPARYHRLTVRTSYDGPFSLEDRAGGGAHGRLIWWRQDTGDFRFLNSREIVTFTDRDTYTVDLRTEPATAVQEPGDRPLLGWPGSRITYLRYDPNEDRGARRWRVDEIALRADDEATESFAVRWVDRAHADGTRVTVRADRDRVGHDGAVVARDVVQRAGENRVDWRVADALPGTYWMSLTATDGSSTSRAYASGPLQVPPRLSGPSRVETAVALSRNALTRSSVAIVASAGNFPDALAAVPLAGALRAPVLVNPTDALHPAVAAELGRLGVREVLLAGGAAAQSAAVESALKGRGYAVRRLSGPDRYATAGELAVAAADAWRSAGDAAAGREVLVALGTDHFHALAAGSLAVADHRPILLVTRDAVPAATTRTLDRLGATTVTIVGSEADVSSGVAQALRAGGRQVERISGANRYAVAAAAARAAVSAGADAHTVLVARGDDFPDALAAGPTVASRGGVLLLTERDRLPGETAQRLAEARAGLRWVRVAGGSAAISDATLRAILAAVGL